MNSECTVSSELEATGGMVNFDAIVSSDVEGVLTSEPRGTGGIVNSETMFAPVEGVAGMSEPPEDAPAPAEESV